VDWIDLAEDKVLLSALVKTAMGPWVPQKADNEGLLVYGERLCFLGLVSPD
jgi:hypothetical protein